ncbi:hypothetical protein ACJX0J_026076 [Zea mays]
MEGHVRGHYEKEHFFCVAVKDMQFINLFWHAYLFIAGLISSFLNCQILFLFDNLYIFCRELQYLLETISSSGGEFFTDGPEGITTYRRLLPIKSRYETSIGASNYLLPVKTRVVIITVINEFLFLATLFQYTLIHFDTMVKTQKGKKHFAYTFHSCFNQTLSII